MGVGDGVGVGVSVGVGVGVNVAEGVGVGPKIGHAGSEEQAERRRKEEGRRTKSATTIRPRRREGNRRARSVKDETGVPFRLCGFDALRAFVPGGSAKRLLASGAKEARFAGLQLVEASVSTDAEGGRCFVSLGVIAGMVPEPCEHKVAERIW